MGLSLRRANALIKFDPQCEGSSQKRRSTRPVYVPRYLWVHIPDCSGRTYLPDILTCRRIHDVRNQNGWTVNNHPGGWSYFVRERRLECESGCAPVVGNTTQPHVSVTGNIRFHTNSELLVGDQGLSNSACERMLVSVQDFLRKGGACGLIPAGGKESRGEVELDVVLGLSYSGNIDDRKLLTYIVESRSGTFWGFEFDKRQAAFKDHRIIGGKRFCVNSTADIRMSNS